MDIELTDRKEVATGTLGLWFTPRGTFNYTAGQFGRFTLETPATTDDKGNSRTFSFAGSPANGQIMIATRMTGSAYKRSLESLPLGTGMQLAGPTGRFTLHEDAGTPAVFLTGGIGITPVRSIVEYAVQQHLPHQLVVFYSNKTRASSAFIEDFEGWAQQHPNLTFIPTLTGEQPRDWKGELGVIDGQMLKKYVPDLTRPIYYIVGPPGMVGTMNDMLAKAGVDEQQIKREDFIGY